MRSECEQRASPMLGLTPGAFVHKDHPRRRIKPLVDLVPALMSLSFDELYASGVRPLIPPEHPLTAYLLMAFYTIRSERQFREQLRYNILSKWSLDLNVEGETFHPTTPAKGRERFLEPDVARVLLKEVACEARRRHLLSADCFTVDETLLKAWASHRNHYPCDEGQAKAMDATASASSWLSAAAAIRRTAAPILRTGCIETSRNGMRVLAILF